MKNGILLKNELSFSGIKKLLLQLDELQELYLAIMEQTQIQLQNINYYSDCKLNITQIYSSNKPLELIETLQKYLIEMKHQKNPKYIKLNKKSKQLIFSLTKAKSVQQQINQYLEILSNLIKKLKYKKECQILITSISLILKKRQKFQLKLLQKHNQLSENLNSISQLVINQENTNDNVKQFLEIKTLQDILEQKVAVKSQRKKQEIESLSQTIKIKQECENSGFFHDKQINEQQYQSQQQICYNNFIYQMYQSYCYFNQLQQTKFNMWNSQLFYNQNPFMYHYYPQFQQNFQQQT
ncbi:unnamed protein product (macronuclear) [Paramecium tetraurelia]|uniref:Uncharacterized protein n=1 Tax=Paramecium tetraurelia TaxID=5888 RepID=A0D434_PARTE|nr:uncharacterized protein GSPATT00013266001 [Paramecium tetraurelia]CAK77801.1 unnamed protein product [Paramecium tetraurelia]|eukprot:XP_001445198.1 hypothetical protein (macronuclear) [Paramecium tetraurelia strain d4-2]